MTIIFTILVDAIYSADIRNWPGAG